MIYTYYFNQVWYKIFQDLRVPTFPNMRHCQDIYFFKLTSKFCPVHVLTGQMWQCSNVSLQYRTGHGSKYDNIRNRYSCVNEGWVIFSNNCRGCLNFLNSAKTGLLQLNIFSGCRNPETVLNVKSGATKWLWMTQIHKGLICFTTVSSDLHKKSMHPADKYTNVCIQYVSSITINSFNI